MKFKFTGPQDEITIRGVTFEKGKAVEVDAELGAKVSGIDGFKPVRARKVKANDKNSA